MLSDALIYGPPLLLLAFVLILISRARRGQRGWSKPLAIIFAILVAWLVIVVVVVITGVLTLDMREF